MEQKRFKMIDEGFVCTVCGRAVEKLGTTARDHCPYCLCSIHLDNNPGDRVANCGGILRPTGIKTSKKGIQIEYVCDICRTSKRNIMAADDDYDLICELSAQ